MNSSEEARDKEIKAALDLYSAFLNQDSGRLPCGRIKAAQPVTSLEDLLRYWAPGADVHSHAPVFLSDKLGGIVKLDFTLVLGNGAMQRISLYSLPTAAEGCTEGWYRYCFTVASMPRLRRGLSRQQFDKFRERLSTMSLVDLHDRSLYDKLCDVGTPLHVTSSKSYASAELQVLHDGKPCVVTIPLWLESKIGSSSAWIREAVTMALQDRQSEEETRNKAAQAVNAQGVKTMTVSVHAYCSDFGLKFYREENLAVVDISPYGQPEAGGQLPVMVAAWEIKDTEGTPRLDARLISTWHRDGKHEGASVLHVKFHTRDERSHPVLCRFGFKLTSAYRHQEAIEQLLMVLAANGVPKAWEAVPSSDLGEARSLKIKAAQPVTSTERLVRYWDQEEIKTEREAGVRTLELSEVTLDDCVRTASLEFGHAMLDIRRVGVPPLPPPAPEELSDGPDACFPTLTSTWRVKTGKKTFLEAKLLSVRGREGRRNAVSVMDLRHTAPTSAQRVCLLRLAFDPQSAQHYQEVIENTLKRIAASIPSAWVPASAKPPCEEIEAAQPEHAREPEGEVSDREEIRYKATPADIKAAQEPFFQWESNLNQLTNLQKVMPRLSTVRRLYRVWSMGLFAGGDDADVRRRMTDELGKIFEEGLQ